jgi:hypothetical protein
MGVPDSGEGGWNLGICSGIRPERLNLAWNGWIPTNRPKFGRSGQIPASWPESDCLKEGRIRLLFGKIDLRFKA